MLKLRQYSIIVLLGGALVSACESRKNADQHPAPLSNGNPPVVDPKQSTPTPSPTPSATPAPAPSETPTPEPTPTTTPVPVIKTWEWTRIEETSLDRNLNMLIIKGRVTGRQEQEVVAYSVGDPNSLLRRLCFDAVTMAFENGEKFQLILSATEIGTSKMLQSCNLMIRPNQ